MSELARILAENYGNGYSDPRLSSDSVDPTTRDTLAAMPRPNGFTSGMRSLAIDILRKYGIAGAIGSSALVLAGLAHSPIQMRPLTNQAEASPLPYGKQCP